MEHFDVAVIGAGLAGLVVAGGLAGRGVRNRVPGPEVTSKIEVVAAAGLSI